MTKLSDLGDYGTYGTACPAAADVRPVRRPGAMTTGTHLIYVPFNSAGVPSGVARMPAAVQEAGVEDLLPAPVSATWIRTDNLRSERGPSALLAEEALTAMIVDTAAAVRAAWDVGARPLVIAGDCPVLLAPLIAAGEAGLVFIDGHEDAWDPRTGPTGEASDSEIGLALGHYPGPAGLDGLPCLHARYLAVLGPRDQEEIAEAGQSSVRGLVHAYLDGPQLAGEPEPHSYTEVGELVAVGPAAAPAGWWCHVDLDVLATGELAAVDYPQAPTGSPHRSLPAGARLSGRQRGHLQP